MLLVRVLFAVIVLSDATQAIGQPPHRAVSELNDARLPRENVLAYRGDDGQIRQAKTVNQWQRRRAEILKSMQSVMGRLPESSNRSAPEVKVINEVDCENYVRRLIEYQSEPGCFVPAYLCVPKSLLGDQPTPGPAALCLHPTDNKVGHKVVVGLGGKENRQYAVELAERGYVTLAPSYPLLANYQPDLDALSWESGSLKAVWDNIRGIDLLQSLPFVRPESIGAIGHSLGGHNAVYTAIFDSRIRAIVSSCGLDSYSDYYGGDPSRWIAGQGWTQRRYIPRLAEYGERLEEIPFDFHEMIAALAPRNTMIIAPLHDGNFQSASVDRVAAAAKQVFELYDHADRLRVEHPDCGHDFPPEMREAAYQMFDETLAAER